MAKTILIVDDDPDFLELLDTVLTPEGYRVVPCTDSTEAYAKARQWRPAVAIIDLLMPAHDGWHIVEQLKSDAVTAGAHVIVCTGHITEATQHTAMLQQWDCEVLFKPFELDDLLLMLERATAQRNAC